MPIATAVERGSFVYVYDEKGRQILTITAGNKPEDGLTGYTSTTVSVRRGGDSFIRTTTRADKSVPTRHDRRQRRAAEVVNRRPRPAGSMRETVGSTPMTTPHGPSVTLTVCRT
jgi:hypothetical protein